MGEHGFYEFINPFFVVLGIWAVTITITAVGSSPLGPGSSRLYYETKAEILAKRKTRARESPATFLRSKYLLPGGKRFPLTGFCKGAARPRGTPRGGLSAI